jgi:hypothetical protein
LGSGVAGTPLAPADILFGAMRTDDELLQRAVAGDADAFGVLFERHARALYNSSFACAVTGARPRT